MKEQDLLQPFLFENTNIRGYIVSLNATYQTIINQREYPQVVKQLLGEAIIGCLFLSASMKFEGKISLQFQGDDCLPLLIVQCDNELKVRAMAKFTEVDNPEDYHQAFLNGKLSLTLENVNQPNAYQSIVPIHSNSMSENLMHYLTQSEQIPNQIWLATSENQVCGVMLQIMPGENTDEQAQFWEYALAMGNTLKADELLTLENAVLLHRLYHETDVRLFDGRTIQFQCRCSDEKMKNVILMLGEVEAQQITQEQGKIEMHCDFCNRQFEFDAIDVAALFHPKNIFGSADPDVEIISEIKKK